MREYSELPWWPEWTHQSACRNTDPELFFDYGKNHRQIAEAKRICYSCPVRLQCLKANLKMPFAIVGGLTWLERWRMLGRPGYPRDTGEYKFFEEIDIIEIMRAKAGKLRWVKSPPGESITGRTG